ncbi:hypothetical protein EV424DRAFT_1343506 [Suillus variegatus]|nr:hypothetical protein EV424DRAFT_1343506 [Suillus variegatus]
MGPQDNSEQCYTGPNDTTHQGQEPEINKLPKGREEGRKRIESLRGRGDNREKGSEGSESSRGCRDDREKGSEGSESSRGHGNDREKGSKLLRGRGDRSGKQIMPTRRAAGCVHGSEMIRALGSWGERGSLGERVGERVMRVRGDCIMEGTREREVQELIYDACVVTTHIVLSGDMHVKPSGKMILDPNNEFSANSGMNLIMVGMHKSEAIGRGSERRPEISRTG